MRAMRGGAEWVLCVVAAIGLSCGGDDGGNDANTQLTGAVWYSGPVAGAEVIAYQLVEGERTTEVGRAITDDAGAFVLDLGLAYESIELEARGGSYDEATGGRIALNNADVLRGIALDVAPAEQRGDLSITPWSHLVVTLGEARLARGDKETTFNAAMIAARDLLEAHVGFDPTGTPFARLDLDAGSPTEPVLQSLSLAGLGSLGAAVATEGGLTAQDVNTSDVTAVLATDLGSDEALFDGNGDILTLGPACGLPPGCTARGDDCRSTCQVYWNTVRSRLALAIAGFLQDEHNGTGLAREDLQSYLAALTANEEPELFGGPVEPLDDLGPEITWIMPASAATVWGTVEVEVAAADPIGVASLVVDVVGVSTTPVTDTAPAAESFTGSIDTTLYPEGSLTLRATAVDDEGNAATAEVTVDLDNIDGGVVSGVVFKGRVAGATVSVFRFPNGAKGALLGQGTTGTDGTVNNIVLADGYSGPLLVEAGGGGSYAEEAAPSGTLPVTLDVSDQLRTVVISYTDGGTVGGVVITPLTSFAVTYLEWLHAQAPTGSLATQWITAHGAMEAHFEVPDILGLTPLAPSQMVSYTAAARYGLVLVGLSQTAYQASTLGGGDGGTFGSAMTAARVWRVLDQDLADGCWDGRISGGTELLYGGTEKPGADATRIDLANGIVAYLSDPSRNTTAFTGPADVLGMLDSLALGGSATGTGSCSATGAIFPTEGDTFDQVGPTVTWTGATPASNTYVRGTITFAAVATDNLDVKPTLVLQRGATTLTDADGDNTDADASATLDTTGLDGALTVTATSQDDSGNVGTISRGVIADNTAPVLTVGAPADGSFRNTAATITFSATDNLSLASLIATVDGSTISSGASVSSEGLHTLVVTATDSAGNMATMTRSFRIDVTAPTVTFDLVTTPAAGSAHNVAFDVVADANDDALASFGVTAPAELVGVDADATLGRVRVSVSPVALGDGSVTVTVTAIDSAGNTTPASRTFVLDVTAPTGTITQATGTWVISASTTLSGTSADATSGVKRIDITRSTPAGFSTSLTTGLANWSTNVDLTAAACGAGWAGGKNTFHVVITDQAGNTSSPPDIELHYDNCDPTVSVVPTPNVAADPSSFLYDERSTTIAITAGTYAPCPYKTAATTTTTLSYDLASPPGTLPQTYKYSGNHGTDPMPCGPSWQVAPPTGTPTPTPIGANQLAWYVAAADNTAIQTVEFQVKGPADVAFGAVKPAFAYALGGSTATHRIHLDETLVPGLDTDGVWEIQLTLTDIHGRVMSPANPIRWQHNVLAGPFYFQSEAITSGVSLPPGWINPTNPSYGVGVGDVMAPLYTSGNVVVIQKIKVFNGTTKPGYASIAPLGSLVCKRQIWEGSHQDLLAASKPTCANVDGETYSPATSSGTCPASATSSQPSTLSTVTCTTVTTQGVDAASPNPPRPSITVGGGTKTAYLVPAGDGASNPGRTDLYLVTGRWSWLMDQTSSDFTFYARGSNSTSTTDDINTTLFGRPGTDFGEYVVDFEGPPVEFHLNKYKQARYLKRATVIPNDQRASCAGNLTPTGVETSATELFASWAFDSGTEPSPSP